ncbi:MAG: hypothetical protein JWQ63_4069 [Mucilaginibacter sp.]|nr:hypothetical protein [Mucilaginibacter sp.]
MKALYKYVSGLVLAGFLSVLMISSVSAQRGGGGHIGGGLRMGGGGGSVGVGLRGNSGIGLRGNTGIGYRGYTRNGYRGGLSFRSGIGYYAGVGYHGGAFYRPGFGYYGYPHLGFYLGVLPFGYYPFYWGSDLYYYYGGVFYSPYDNGGYQVTTPPIGAAVPELPKTAQPIKIDGVQYYEQDGVYYKEGVDDKGKKIYIVAGRDGVLNTDASVTDPNATVAAPQVGDIVNQLPDGCRKVILNGKKYYVSPNDIYYEKVTDPDGNVAYKIASLPQDEKGV